MLLQTTHIKEESNLIPKSTRVMLGRPHPTIEVTSTLLLRITNRIGC
jgi:hypothetical protein